jgi:hypothetical protein
MLGIAFFNDIRLGRVLSKDGISTSLSSYFGPVNYGHAEKTL